LKHEEAEGKHQRKTPHPPKKKPNNKRKQTTTYKKYYSVCKQVMKAKHWKNND